MRIIETYYLVDYENVHCDGLNGCEELGKTDHIFIFFTKNAKSIDMSEISDHGGAELKMIEVPVGKQSADMHIVSFLGYLAGKKGKNCNAVIVSKDTDFDNVVAFWEETTGITASRVQQIRKKTAIRKSSESRHSVIQKKPNITVVGTQKTKLNSETMQAVKRAGFSASVANTAAQIASRLYGDEHMLVEVHNALRDHCPNYLEVYRAMKPVLSKYEGDISSKNKMPTAAAKDRTATNVAIMKLLSKAGYSNDIVAYTASTAVKNLGVKNGKQQIYKAIVAKYGQKKGSAIYNQIRKNI